MKVISATPADKTWIKETATARWDAEFVVAKGRKLYPAEHQALIAVDPKGLKLGLLTYSIEGDRCEIITIDAFEKNRGVGTALIEKLAVEANSKGCRSLWLIAVNDNLNAIRFYQCRGFTMCGFNKDALKESRKLKPSIPLIGDYGIKLEHELEFERVL